jgi:hypothetical protein
MKSKCRIGKTQLLLISPLANRLPSRRAQQKCVTIQPKHAKLLKTHFV